MVAYGFPYPSILYPVPAYVLAQGEGGWRDGVGAGPLRGLASITQKHKAVAGLACRLADGFRGRTCEGPSVPLGLACFPRGGHQLRSVLIDGEPWFVAADACRCLGLPFGSGTGSVSRHLTNLDRDERKVVTRQTYTGSELLTLFPRGAQSLTIISRPGLFKLIQRSNKPEAKEFDRWVRHEVLPQVMDNGGYMLPLSPSQPPPKPPLSRPTAGQ